MSLTEASSWWSRSRCSTVGVCVCMNIAVHTSQINVNIKTELKIFISQRRHSNKLDLSFCLQFVLLSGFDHLPASACHVKPFYSD